MQQMVLNTVAEVIQYQSNVVPHTFLIETLNNVNAASSLGDHGKNVAARRG